MKIDTFYNAVELNRVEKVVYANFLKPHRVLSTCRAHGGLKSDLNFVFNHQSCEPVDHSWHHDIAVKDPGQYHQMIVEKYGLPQKKAAAMGTAANMNNLSIAKKNHQALEVMAIGTAGVETNAGRAGDAASYYQKKGKFVKVNKDSLPAAGTIVIMLFVNQELTPGAMVTALITATEAKTAKLQELLVPSRYSDGWATGTGTDQILIASQIGGEELYNDAGKHGKLGELIGTAVKEVVAKALASQNGMTPPGRCSSEVVLSRFGIRGLDLVHSVKPLLTPEKSALFEKNHLSILNDPVTVSCLAGLCHQYDLIKWGIITESCYPEILVHQGSLLATVISGKQVKILQFQKVLASKIQGFGNDHFLRFIFECIALGFDSKWEG